MSDFTIQIDYTDEANYELDEGLVVEDGAVKPDKQEPGLVGYWPFRTATAQSYGDANPTVASTGQFTSDWHSLYFGGTSKKMTMNPDTIALVDQAFTVDFWVKPVYSGSPAATEYYLWFGGSPASYQNQLSMIHNPSGAVQIVLKDDNNVAIFSASFAWAPVYNQEYHWRIAVDITAGTAAIWLDGVKQYENLSITAPNGWYSSKIAYVYMGGDHQAVEQASRYSFRELTIYDKALTDETFTPPVALGTNYYRTDFLRGKTNLVIKTDSIANITETLKATLPAGTRVRYQPIVNDVEHWHNGSTWIPSTSYEDSNTLAEILAGLGDWIQDKILLRIAFLLESSSDGSLRPELDKNSISYGYTGDQPADHDLSIIVGYVRDSQDQPLSGIKATIRLKKQVNIGDAGVANKSISMLTDDDGFFRFVVLRESAMTDPVPYILTLEGDSYHKVLKLNITAALYDVSGQL